MHSYGYVVTRLNSIIKGQKSSVCITVCTAIQCVRDESCRCKINNYYNFIPGSPLGPELPGSPASPFCPIYTYIYIYIYIYIYTFKLILSTKIAS